MKLIDLTGKRFGEWAVLSRVEGAYPVKWNCVCSCGEHREVNSQTLRKAQSTSCGSGVRHPDRKSACRDTTRDFIVKATAKHGAKYDYSKVEYFNAKTKVVISCNTCGSTFSQTANLHLSNAGGCKICVSARARVPEVNYVGKVFGHLNVLRWENGKWLCQCDCGNMKHVATTHLKNGATRSCGCINKWTLEQFIRDAEHVHGDRFDYSAVEFKDSNTPVQIRCRKHDYNFKQSPQAHVAGRGCIKCGFESTKVKQACSKEDFIVKARGVHGEKYDYSAVEYVNVSTKIKIICNSCGSKFIQSPNAHLVGKGCVTCNKTGYDATKPGYFYVLRGETFVKIGITNKNPEIRLKSIRKSCNENVLLHAYFLLEDGQYCSDLETKLLRYLRTLYNNPTQTFDGSTEAFVGLCANEVVEMLQCLI
jgi:hypothetical protein